MTHAPVYWTQGLQAAAQAVARDQSEWSSDELRQRAYELATKATVGKRLEPHQISLVQAFRSRLDCNPIEPIQSHIDFEAAWSGAYAEALDASGLA